MAWKYKRGEVWWIGTRANGRLIAKSTGEQFGFQKQLFISQVISFCIVAFLLQRLTGFLGTLDGGEDFVGFVVRRFLRLDEAEAGEGQVGAVGENHVSLVGLPVF